MAFKRFFVGVIGIAFFIVGILYPSLFFLQLGLRRSNAQYIQNWFVYKEKYAHSIKEHKIIVISGSNSLFSIQAGEIEKQLEIPTVNYGVHAGLGLKYLLHRSKKIINEGDVVLLPLEYQMYQDDEPFGGEYNTFISSFDPYYFTNNSLLYKLKFIYSMKFSDIKNGILDEYRHKKRVAAYDNLSLNKNGDIIGNTVEKSDRLKIKEGALGFSKNESYPTKDAKAILDDFLDYCQKKNCAIFVSFPAYYVSTRGFKSNDLRAIQEITDYWDSQEDVTLLSTYSDNLYDIDDFYDGNYHMNDRGRNKRTKQIICKLKPILK